MININSNGIMYIGDPHVSSKNPGRRIDNWNKTIMGKLDFLIDAANKNNVVPVILGDLFHNWFESENSDQTISTPAMISGVMRCFSKSNHPVIVLAGNHDINDSSFSEDSTLSIIDASGSAIVIKESKLYATITTPNGRILLGGTPYGQVMPRRMTEDMKENKCDRCVWVVHRDIKGMGTIDGVEPLAIDGVDLVVGGHIHTTQPIVKKGETKWFVPGNIARLSMSEANNKPKVYMDFNNKSLKMLEVPHESIEMVMDLTGRQESIDSFDKSKFDLSNKTTQELIAEMQSFGNSLTSKKTSDLSTIMEVIEGLKNGGSSGLAPEVFDVMDKIISNIKGQEDNNEALHTM